MHVLLAPRQLLAVIIVSSQHFMDTVGSVWRLGLVCPATWRSYQCRPVCAKMGRVLTLSHLWFGSAALRDMNGEPGSHHRSQNPSLLVHVECRLWKRQMLQAQQYRSLQRPSDICA